MNDVQLMCINYDTLPSSFSNRLRITCYTYPSLQLDNHQKLVNIYKSILGCYPLDPGNEIISITKDPCCALLIYINLHT